MNAKFQNIKNFLKEGEINKALKDLVDLVGENELANEAILLSSRHSFITSCFQKGITDLQEYSVENNRIAFSILQLLEKHPSANNVNYNKTPHEYDIMNFTPKIIKYLNYISSIPDSSNLPYFTTDSLVSCYIMPFVKRNENVRSGYFVYNNYYSETDEINDFVISKDEDLLEWGTELNNISQAVIIGKPGAGKSTLLQMSAREIALKSLANGIENENVSLIHIPFYLKLKDVIEHGLLNAIVFSFKNAYVNKKEVFQDEQVDFFLRDFAFSSNSWIFLDAFDEAGEIDKITKELMVLRGSKCKIIITTRPIGYTSSALPSNEFVHYELKELKTSNVDEFIVNYFKNSSHVIGKVYEIIELNSKVADLIHNPLMLTLICFAFKLNSKVESLNNRAHIYYLIILGLLERNNNKSILEGVFIYKIIQKASWELYKKNSSSNFFRFDKFEEIISKVIRESSIQISTKNTIDHLRKSGIITSLRWGYFSFMHKSFFDFFVASELSENQPEQIISFIEDLLWGNNIEIHNYWSLSTKEIILFTSSMTSPKIILSRIVEEAKKSKTLFKPLLFLASEIIMECDKDALPEKQINEVFDLIENSVEINVFFDCIQSSSFDDIVTSLPKNFLIKIINSKKFDDRLRVSAFYKIAKTTTNNNLDIFDKFINDSTFSIRSISFSNKIRYSSYDKIIDFLNYSLLNTSNWELKITALEYLMSFMGWVYNIHFPSSPIELEKCKEFGFPRIHILPLINENEDRAIRFFGAVLVLDKPKPSLKKQFPKLINEYAIQYLINLNCSIEFGLSYTKHFEEFDLQILRNNINLIDSEIAFKDAISSLQENIFDDTQLILTEEDIKTICLELYKSENTKTHKKSISLNRIVEKIFNKIIFDGLKEDKIRFNIINISAYLNKDNKIASDELIDFEGLEEPLALINRENSNIERRLEALEYIKFINCQEFEKELMPIFKNPKEELEIRHRILDLGYEKKCKNLGVYFLDVLSDITEDPTLRMAVLEIGFYFDKNRYFEILVDIISNSSEDMSFRKDVTTKICDFKPIQQFDRIEKLMLRHLADKEDYISIPFELAYVYFSMVRDLGYCGIGLE